MGFLCKFLGTTTHYGHLHARLCLFWSFLSLSLLLMRALPRWLALSIPSPLKCKRRKKSQRHNIQGIHSATRPKSIHLHYSHHFHPNRFVSGFFPLYLLEQLWWILFLGVFFFHHSHKNWIFTDIFRRILIWEQQKRRQQQQQPLRQQQQKYEWLITQKVVARIVGPLWALIQNA